MEYSRRALYALGEPFGDSATHKVAGGRIIYGGGGGKQPSSTTQTAELPAWARGYAKDVLAKGAALTDINSNPYVKYGGERLAGFSPMQQQSFNSAQNMQVAPQIGLGSAYAAQSGQYSPVGQQYTGSNVNQYMNPYLEGALAPQLREAASAGMQAQNMNAAKAVGMGAFGGTRGALQKSLTEKNTMQNMADINAKGYSDAFNQAANMFNIDQQRRIQEAQYGNTAQQQAADLLSRLGGQQFQQGMDINKLQNVYGQQQQSQAQKAADIGYQDFLDQQNYAYKQLGFMSDLIKNPAIGSSSQRQMYENNSGNDLATLGGLGALGKGAGLFKEGGMVGYADGGDITSYVKRLSDDQLANALKQARQDQDQERIIALTAEMQYRQEVRGAQAMPQEQPMDQGLAALPAGPMPQMASGGIVAFAEGATVKGDPKEAYRAYALKQADVLGIDRGLVDSIFQTESGYNPNARNPTSSATGIGQLVKKTGRSLGLKDEDFTDPYKNIDASLTLMATLNDKYDGDPAKIAMAYHDGETLADKHLKANNGNINPTQLKPEAQGYLKKVVGGVISSAQAATPAGLAGTSPAQEPRAPISTDFNRRAERTWSQVPGEALVNAPESAGNLFSSLGQMVTHPLTTIGNVMDIGGGALQYALPESVTNAINAYSTPEQQEAAAKQREAASRTAQFFRDRYGSEQGIKETLAMDPVGALADIVGTAAGGVGIARRGIATANKIGEVRKANKAVVAAEGLQDTAAAKQAVAAADAAKAAAVMGPQRVLPTDPRLIAPTTIPSGLVAASNAQANARTAAKVNAAEKAAATSGLAATEAGAAAAAARTATEANIAAARAPMAVKPIPRTVKGVAAAALAAKLPETFDDPAPTKDETPAEDLSKWEKEQVVAATKEATKEVAPDAVKKDSGFTNDDWLMLGLNMLAKNTGNKGFGQILGEAGLPTLLSKKDREKLEREQESQKFVDEYRQSQAKLNEAQAKYYGSDTRQMAQAVKAGDVAFDNWKSGLSQIEKFNMTKEQIDAKRKEFLQEAFAMYNIDMPAGLPAGAPTGGSTLKYDAATGTIK